MKLRKIGDNGDEDNGLKDMEFSFDGDGVNDNKNKSEDKGDK